MGTADFWILDEKTARLLAKPLHNPLVPAAFHQQGRPVQRIGRPAFLRGRLGPFVHHGEGKTQFTRQVLGADLLKDLAHYFMGFHAGHNANTRRVWQAGFILVGRTTKFFGGRDGALRLSQNSNEIF